MMTTDRFVLDRECDQYVHQDAANHLDDEVKSMSLHYLQHFDHGYPEIQ